MELWISPVIPNGEMGRLTELTRIIQYGIILMGYVSNKKSCAIENYQKRKY